MRLVNSQRSPDCGMIALYNVARVLRLDSAKGGFQANRARLARNVCYTPERGCSLMATRKALVEEIYNGGFTINVRRPFWRNIPGQLMRAKAPAVGVVAWTTPTKSDPHAAHIAVVWKPYDYDVILCANAQTGGKETVPFWITYGSTQWATASLPPMVYDSKLLGFWQIVPGRPLGENGLSSPRPG